MRTGNLPDRLDGYGPLANSLNGLIQAENVREPCRSVR